MSAFDPKRTSLRSETDPSRAQAQVATITCRICGLNQPEIGWPGVAEYLLHALRREAVHLLRKAGEQRAIIGEHRIVAVLEQGRLLDLDLLAGDASAVDAAAEHPVDAAVAVVGAAIAVLAEGAAEFGDYHHHGL